MRASIPWVFAIISLAGCGGTRVTLEHEGDGRGVVAVSFDEALSLSTPVEDVRCHFVDADGKELGEVLMTPAGRSSRGWKYVAATPAPLEARGYSVTFVNSNGDLRRLPAAGAFALEP